ncbi:hypothetical protein SAMN05192543_10435 [Paraburkholderia megapolitana]|uniref:Uncharacterized protein n=2 Tax=Paraburkholderia megapolitana TaxID=420953 RepID=A0A1I3KL08_9BURK|nr:hypothetical protein SAMN05192543_10435 [Paraburkholderia megapolitana]
MQYESKGVGMSLQEIPKSGLQAFVAELAKRHGIQYVRTGSSALAQVITKLADDEVVPDETEKLIIALKRAKVIDGREMRVMLSRYLDEVPTKKPVNPEAPPNYDYSASARIARSSVEVSCEADT